jgi:hypothetical protein
VCALRCSRRRAQRLARPRPYADICLLSADDLQAPTATPTATPIATPTLATPTTTIIPTVTLTGSPAPTHTPTLPPPSYSDCQDDPNPSAAPNYPVRIVNIDKVAETVTLRNVTTADTIDLTIWQMCSITGNQHHPIGGTLAPGQTRTFSGLTGSIWNNSSRDDGALYDGAGHLVSYWFD